MKLLTAGHQPKLLKAPLSPVARMLGHVEDWDLEAYGLAHFTLGQMWEAVIALGEQSGLSSSRSSDLLFEYWMLEQKAYAYRIRRSEHCQGYPGMLV
jgi:hypothetical protein